MAIPVLVKENGAFNLYVDDKPYIALAGELHNSSASDLGYMSSKVWPYLRELHLNTVILPVYWELIEPSRDEFDFRLLDGLVEQARQEGARLVLLWFGLWKNGMSSYVPGWVKRDWRTYFRAVHRNGEPSNTISPLCEPAVEADAKAFRQLMSHLKQIDGNEHTVIMVQIENEIGFLGSDRDYSEAANTRFQDSIPSNVAAAYGKEEGWQEAFADEAQELFMAYHYARAVERIASAGAEVYPLPMFVNAWLEQYPWRPGNYPSGGPIAKVMKMWKLAAPTICLYAPDIYLPNFTEICEEYTAGNENPLFIPEARRDMVAASNVFYALGKHDALCYAPFGIEDFLAHPSTAGAPDLRLMMALNIDVSAFNMNGTGPVLAQSYELLGNMLDMIQQYRGTDSMTGFVWNHNLGCVLSFAKYDLKITYARPQENQPIAAGLVIEVAEDEFIVAGVSFEFEFLLKRGAPGKLGMIRAEEGSFSENQWIRGRVLNGDQSAYNLKIGRKPAAMRVEVYRYQ
ncbi:DUF5597 domain-containing protein [Paenibacillus lutimineralis]|uniref:Beta-galactosidase n=1 Tax=Paenibacillus lutimineralis TaxID=2707005 RepID=A0A3Q9I7A6_9BACL|nr:DUF5597 domain-containing protein [Paenibacillus lutimineralis]AZS14319.1 hypothetical protein EI981_07510 [Paenibacillus lutimineralis]